ncbi:2-succinyl-5-enolpyruvyl-6-hydroxy-3-cyclohexene-1-carboxylic-acid synthase [Brachybacterium sp. EF45031]|uniref:2-succinyl-5-enolpyruvyl-6-hydroxy-3- cyclohexene-1-carboxylic-acid synthase n=1 Tax=Brachybacterium sillae TaxID=2810536 RepID=UPI00217DF242|nr:2-succinyl-5-enolpyruvyl-6-hydroxy-3-cyclohexene-1-carboxylic-acid synthase [Brachybacterium sillae]MCS6711280.1 2-succinyl-5-enolpyruvyl-6-hydroxy-3-cyclohexene-1-carboxylic-acid synthase [Brachybacterium sillae]
MTAAPPETIRPAAPTGSGAVDAAIVLWRALIGLGVRDVVLSPGSRSAPLVHALAAPDLARDLRVHVRIDERAASFTALGLSRGAPQHPAAVVTTSGTATAHLHAAILEAHHARVPLLALTADRPAELRDTGANQTVHQVGLYGDAVRFAADLPAPAADRAEAAHLRTVVGTAARAVAAARGEIGAAAGPVHLNLGFRDPLVPSAPVGADDPSAPALTLTRRIPASAPEPVPVEVTGRTVLVAGDGAGVEAARLAEAHDLPLLAEPASGARRGAALIPTYPTLLPQVLAGEEHPARPDRVLVLGRPTLSRPVVSGLLGDPRVDVVVVDPTGPWPDAARRARLVAPAVEPVAPGSQMAQAQRDFAQQWRRLAADGTGPGSLPWQAQAALAVWEAAGPEDVLVLGSSSLVRDLERSAGPTRATVLANRGVAGIDGLLSTATGVALARRDAPGRVHVLVGDLTALHDLTGLIIGPDEEQPPLDVIVVDDDGGRIFAGLEHAAAPAALVRRFFTTPHGTDIAAAAQALGVPSRTLRATDLPAALTDPAPRRRLLCVREDS